MEKDYLINHTCVYTDKYHKIGTDSLLLAEFCSIKPTQTVCDLGTGCGILLLALYDKGLRGNSVGIDRDETATKLFQQSIIENKILCFESICQDFANYKPKNQFSAVVCNPPYFSQGRVSNVLLKAQARHEITTHIKQVAKTAFYLLQDKGCFFVCWPVERLVDLMCALRSANLEPKKMQMVYSKISKNPYLVLVEAKKNAGNGLKILPHYIINKD